jgi:hypothetical protein
MAVAGWRWPLRDAAITIQVVTFGLVTPQNQA